jgi:hypothetical protein
MQQLRGALHQCGIAPMATTLSSEWGKLETGKVWDSHRLPKDGPHHRHLLGNPHALPHSLIIG